MKSNRCYDISLCNRTNNSINRNVIVYYYRKNKYQNQTLKCDIKQIKVVNRNRDN